MRALAACYRASQMIPVFHGKILAAGLLLSQIQPVCAAQDDQGPRGWISGYGGSAEYADNGISLTAVRYGVSLGSDMSLGDGWTGGASVSLGQQHFQSGDSSGASNDLLFGIYGSKTFLERGYVMGSLAYGWHDIVTSRTVFGAARERGAVTSRELGGRLEAGWRWWLDPQYSVAPFVAVGGVTFHTPAYSETAITGPAFLAASYAAHDSNVGHTEFGSRLGRSFETGQDRLWVEATLGWAHELDDTAFAQTVFSVLDGFAVSSIVPTRDTALLGLNLQAQRPDGLSYGARFDSQVGGNTTVLSGTANIAWRW